MTNFTKLKLWSIRTSMVLVLTVNLFPLSGQTLLTSYASGKQVINVNQKKNAITIKADSITLENILRTIEEQTQFVFIYSETEIPTKATFSLSVKNKPVEVFLSEILAPINVKFKVYKTQVVLSSDKKDSTSNSDTKSNAADELIVLPNMKEEQPNHELKSEVGVLFAVRGIITDDTSSPLPGVNVLEKGTTNGTVTDASGQYSLNVANENAVLVFSYIGFVSEEVSVNNQSTVDVSLTPDIETLSEVVIVGYGQQKRADLTGAVASVKASDVHNLPTRSLSEAIQGRVAGVTVTKGEGAPGAGSDIVIRGAGSINGMAPLFIVDGVRMGTGFNFNMQDVESIEVLKDASAAAIYGSQAAGGVILVTTKRGTKDKMTINFNSYAGVRTPINLYNLLDRDDFVAAKAAFGTDVSTWGDISTLPDTDWVDELFSNGSDQSYSLSISGGSTNANYYLSSSYQREDGIRLDSWAKRVSVRFNSDYQLHKNLKIGETLYAWKSIVNPASGGEIPFRSVPTMNVYDRTNPAGGWGKTPSYFAGPNPVGNELIHHREDEAYGLEGNVYAEWKIFKDLSVRGTLGTAFIGRNYSQYGKTEFTEAFDFGAVKNSNATLDRHLWNGENYTANVVATYTKNVGLHNFKVMGGYEMYRQDFDYVGGFASGFSTPYAESFNLNNNLSSQRVVGGEVQAQRLLSQFGRIDYSYNDRYLLTANVRHDGNDKFAPKNRWGWFPSVSAAWKLSEESFMSNVEFVSNLKLRAGYGVLGNDGNINAFTYQGSYGSQIITGLPDGQRVLGWGLNPQLPNDQIKWEEVSTLDIGLEAGLFENRLNVTLDYYERKTKDMIYQLRVPRSAGLGDYVPANIGQMDNKGLEVTIDYRGQLGELKYQVGFNSSFNVNKVVALDGEENVPIEDGSAGADVQGPVSRTAVDNSIGRFYGYVVEGIYQTDQQVAERGVTQTGAGAGDLIYKDVNNDGTIDENDRTYIGNPWPKMSYGISASLGWKGFDLSVLFNGVQGVDVYNGAKYFTQFLKGDYNTTSDIFNASFFDGNGLTSQPRVGFTDGGGNYVRDPNGNYTKVSSYYVEDGSYLKLRNIQLGYTFPKTMSSRVGLANARLYFMAQNVFTITSYSGMDPEVVGNGARAGTTARGIDTFSSYPRTRLFSIGVDLTF